MTFRSGPLCGALVPEFPGYEEEKRVNDTCVEGPSHKSIVEKDIMSYPLFSLEGKRALVTGSSQGIGLALAKGLADHGALVVLNGRDPGKLEAAAGKLSAGGHKVSTAVFDVTSAEAVKNGIGSIESNEGPIDILINNAGMQYRTPLEDFPVERWEQLLTTNISSVFFVGQAAARHMIARRRGKIINIASVQSELARPGIAPYTATKGAVKNLTRGMCADWARHGLQVNAIAPGYFKTPLNQALVDSPEFSDWLEKRTPAARWGNVEELVGAAVFLSSDASSFVNGHTLYVDGGITTCL
jgi:gluconate 5-dehydrogenase